MRTDDSLGEIYQILPQAQTKLVNLNDRIRLATGEPPERELTDAWWQLEDLVLLVGELSNRAPV